jgi:hypothetical protein
MSTRAVSSWLGLLGISTVGAALTWWVILFPTVVANTVLSFVEAIPCIASNSDLCLLETHLCGGHHLFGIRHYSPSLFWCGIALLSASLFAANMLPSASRREGPANEGQALKLLTACIVSHAMNAWCRPSSPPCLGRERRVAFRNDSDHRWQAK